MMAMALRYAILTALTERSSTGIELARRFDRSFGYFWSATHQQIYREIGLLTSEGLVSSTPTTTGRGRPRQLAITEAGEGELRRWSAELNDPPAPREALMIKLRAAQTVADFAALRPLVEHHLRIHEQTRHTYEQIEQRDFAGMSVPGVDLGHLILHGGLLIESAWIEWCRTALASIDAIAADRSGDFGDVV